MPFYDWVAADDLAPGCDDDPGSAVVEYVQTVLSTLYRAAPPLLYGRPVDIDGFRLRGRHHGERHVDLAAAGPGRVFALDTTADTTADTIAPEAVGGRRNTARDGACGTLAALVATHVDVLTRLSIPELAERPAIAATLAVAGRAAGGWQAAFADLRDFRFSYPVAWFGRSKDMASYCAWLWRSMFDMIVLRAAGCDVLPDAVRVAERVVPIPRIAPDAAMVAGPRAQQSKRSTRQPLHSIAATEPRIALLARHWGLIAGLSEVGGSAGTGSESGTIDGFSLRDLRDWTVPSSGHPSEIYEYLARVCNVACKFCYLYGNPDAIAVARGAAVISRTEMDTRLRYFAPHRGTTLFSAQWEINEFLVDPKLSQVLTALRQVSEEPFYFITNGSPLKPAVIDTLRAARPVHLMISINSIEDGRRAEVMQETENQTAVARAALTMLADAEIPFAISLAAFPDFGLDELERTIRIATAHGAAFVRINLPGYTRNAPYVAGIDLDAYWLKVRDWVEALRPSVPIPLMLIPSAFESADPLDPRALGAIPGSPFAEAGLAPGDLVRSVNGIAIATRAELLSLLLLMRRPFTVEVARGDAQVQLHVDTQSRGRYPWSGHVLCKYLFPWGLALAPSLSRSDALAVADAIASAGAQTCWMLSSRLMAPMARELLQRHIPDCAGSIRLVPVENRFLGGNIQIMDMATIGDMAATIEAEIARTHSRPDLLLVSQSAFNVEGRDLLGRHWEDLERHLGIAVRLIPVSRFSF